MSIHTHATDLQYWSLMVQVDRSCVSHAILCESDRTRMRPQGLERARFIMLSTTVIQYIARPTRCRWHVRKDLEQDPLIQVNSRLTASSMTISHLDYNLYAIHLLWNRDAYPCQHPGAPGFAAKCDGKEASALESECEASKD